MTVKGAAPSIVALLMLLNLWVGRNGVTFTPLARMKLSDLLVIVLLGLVFILFLPIILPVVAYSYVRTLINERRYKRYLRWNEGATFFAYTDKPSSKAYVEEQVLPFLSTNVRIFHLAGKKGRYNMGEDFGLLAWVVSDMRGAGGGFPFIAKIANGELVAESINNRLYSAVRRDAGPEKIHEQIDRFFSSNV